LASGMNPDEIVKEYSQLTKEDILAVLDYAAKTIKREELIAV